MGTANDLARSLSVPLEVPGAIESILGGERRSIDLGEVNDTLYFNAVNIGLGVRVTHELSAETKKTWGVFSYLKALCASLSKKDAFDVRININGHAHRMRSIQVAVGNGRLGLSCDL